MSTYYKILFCFVLALSITGCVPYLASNDYIELKPGNGVKVTRTGKQSAHQTLINHGVIPLAYELERERYKLNMFMIPGRLGRHMVVSFTEETDNLTLVPIEIDNSCGAFRNEMYHLNRGHRPSGSIFYMWGIKTKICMSINRDPKLEPHPVISFNVVDNSGAVIGSEKIDYEIKQNGRYITFDAI